MQVFQLMNLQWMFGSFSVGGGQKKLMDSKTRQITALLLWWKCRGTVSDLHFQLKTFTSSKSCFCPSDGCDCSIPAPFYSGLVGSKNILLSSSWALHCGLLLEPVCILVHTLQSVLGRGVARRGGRVCLQTWNQQTNPVTIIAYLCMLKKYQRKNQMIS